MKKVLIALVVLVVGFVGFVASRPSAFHIERTVSIAASAEDAYTTLIDLKQFSEWSPWDKLDPAMKRSFSGAPGVGSHYEWAGNDKVGEGAMTVSAVQPNEKVTLQLEFKKPFAQTNTVTWAIRPQGEDQVSVTWAMDGENGFMGKAFGVIMDMDKMIGADFDKGLASLKSLVEAKAQKRKADAEAAKKAADEEAARKAAEEAAKAEAPAAAPAPPAKKKQKK